MFSEVIFSRRKKGGYLKHLILISALLVFLITCNSYAYAYVVEVNPDIIHDINVDQDQLHDIDADNLYFKEPTAPSNLSASGVSSSQIDLTWKDTSSNELGFKIERSLNSSEWAEVETVPANSTNYSDTGLDASTPFYYRLRAYNVIGNSDYSALAKASTLDAVSDKPVTVQFSSADYTVDEDEGKAYITVKCDWNDAAASKDTVYVYHQSSEGTADANSDYRDVDGEVTFTYGEIEKTFAVPILDDYLVEEDETVNLRLLDAAGNAEFGEQDKALLTIIDNESVTVNEPEPDVDEVPEGVFVARWPGHMPLVEHAVKLSTPESKITIQVDQSKLNIASSRGLEPRIYVWNKKYEKWVALASYLQGDKVIAKNDGNYTGWIAVFGVRQPYFVDLYLSDWYEPILNRSNGLALLEGYPVDSRHPEALSRTAKPNGDMTRAEYIAMVTRALGLVADDEQQMYDVLVDVPEEDIDIVLSEHFTDADEILEWAREPVAAAVESGLLEGVSGIESRFGPSKKITRIQAAVIISNALSKLPEYRYIPLDFSMFNDSARVPAWAVGKVAQGVIKGDTEGNLEPNRTIKRCEAYALFLRLLRGLDW